MTFSSTFEKNAPSYISVMALVNAIGLAHNWFLHQSSPTARKDTITHKLARQYSSIAQCIIAGMSFIPVMDSPHLQQIISTCLLFAFNICQFTPQLWRWISPNKNNMDANEQSSHSTKLNKQKAIHYDTDEDDLKDDTHQRHQQKQPSTLYQPKNNNSGIQSSSSSSKLSSNELSSTMRLVLTWVKNAVLSYGASLPTLLANNSHLSRSKFSVLNPLSWFSSSDYSSLNPFSLSFINLFGIGLALCAIGWVVYSNISTNKKMKKTIQAWVPSWYNNIFNYTLFVGGLFLSTFRFGSPMTWLSIITPIGSCVAAVIRLIKNYQQNNIVVPSLIQKIEKQSWAQDLIKASDKLLPGVVF